MLYASVQATKIAAVILLALLTVEVTHWGFVRATATTTTPRLVVVVVAPDESGDELARGLQAAGLVRSAALFQAELTLDHPSGGIRPGRYALPTGMAMSQIIDALSQPVPAPANP